MHKIVYAFLFISFTSFAASNLDEKLAAGIPGTPVPAGSGASAALNAPGEAFAIDMAGGGVANPKVDPEVALRALEELKARILGDYELLDLLAEAMVPTPKHMPRKVIQALEWSLLVSVLGKMLDEKQITQNHIFQACAYYTCTCYDFKFVPFSTGNFADFVSKIITGAVTPDFVKFLNVAVESDAWKGHLDSFTKYVSDHKDLRQLLAQIILHRTPPKVGEVYPVDSVLGIPPGSFSVFSDAVLAQMVNAGKITSEEKVTIEEGCIRACKAPPTDPDESTLGGVYGVFAGAVELVSGWFSATSTATPPSQPAP